VHTAEVFRRQAGPAGLRPRARKPARATTTTSSFHWPRSTALQHGEHDPPQMRLQYNGPFQEAMLQLAFRKTHWCVEQ